ncbi:MAG TPA: glutaredoxin family protein [Candidatus Binatia bacterium]|nr:glutaredoxin family protein [Candidatus Binatia bacterium]
MTVRFTLLTRPECHLCEEFRDELGAAFAGRYELVEACVDDRADWRAAHGTVIPVLLDQRGAVVCRTRFDAGAVARALR